MKQITGEELRAIRERAEKATEGNPLVDIDALIRREEVINEDIPKLLAEIIRLRYIADDLLYSNNLSYDEIEWYEKLIRGDSE